MRTGDIIKMLRNERRISQAKLADELSVSKSTIAMYETNERMPKPELLEAIADFFNVDMNFLYGKTHIRNSANEISKNEVPENVIFPYMHKVPKLGQISCGQPIFASEEHDEYGLIANSVKADFCLEANGDSMIGARIFDGDLVFCIQTNVVDNGQIAVVLVDDEATLKRFYYYPEKDTVILKPENPNYEDLIYSGEELNQISILGKAVAFQSRVK